MQQTIHHELPMPQVPGCVIDAISSYMIRSYVQLSAGYKAYNIATRTVHDFQDVVKVLMIALALERWCWGPELHS